MSPLVNKTCFLFKNKNNFFEIMRFLIIKTEKNIFYILFLKKLKNSKDISFYYDFFEFSRKRFQNFLRGEDDDVCFEGLLIFDATLFARVYPGVVEKLFKLGYVPLDWRDEKNDRPSKVFVIFVFDISIKGLEKYVFCKESNGLKNVFAGSISRFLFFSLLPMVLTSL